MARAVEEQETVLSINTISQGTEIKGDIISSGDIRIDGSINGNMDIKGKIVVGKSGKIEGSITCKVLEVSGFIEGKIFTSQLLNLKSSAKIFGDIETVKIAIEPGAIFTGNCKMTEDGKKE